METARSARARCRRRDTVAVDNDVKLTSGAANRTRQSAISPVSNAPAPLLSPGKQDYIKIHGWRQQQASSEPADAGAPFCAAEPPDLCAHRRRTGGGAVSSLPGSSARR